jgi:hypothetical protein
MIRHRDSWEEKHHVFYGNCLVFYQNTTSLPTPCHNPKSAALRTSESHDEWILESKAGDLWGRVKIQATHGEFNQATLHIHLATPPNDVDIPQALAELITSQFVGRSLDHIKIFPLESNAATCIRTLTDQSDPPRILSFSNEWFPRSMSPIMYPIDREPWLTSSVGQESLKKLGWLNRRVERAEALRDRGTKEKKKPWIVSLLFWGRRRREPMIHPLTRFRARRF